MPNTRRSTILRTLVLALVLSGYAVSSTEEEGRNPAFDRFDSIVYSYLKEYALNPETEDVGTMYEVPLFTDDGENCPITGFHGLGQGKGYAVGSDGGYNPSHTTLTPSEPSSIASNISMQPGIPQPENTAVLVVDDFATHDGDANVQDSATSNLNSRNKPAHGETVLNHTLSLFGPFHQANGVYKSRDFNNIVVVEVNLNYNTALTTKEISTAIYQVNSDHAIDSFVINMSFVIVPCNVKDDFDLLFANRDSNYSPEDVNADAYVKELETVDWVQKFHAELAKIAEPSQAPIGLNRQSLVLKASFQQRGGVEEQINTFGQALNVYNEELRDNFLQALREYGAEAFADYYEYLITPQDSYGTQVRLEDRTPFQQHLLKLILTPLDPETDPLLCLTDRLDRMEGTSEEAQEKLEELTAVCAQLLDNQENTHLDLQTGQLTTVLVASSGNHNFNFSLYPAAWPEVIGVSAHDEPLSNPIEKSLFSNDGEIMAPGNLFELGNARYLGTSYAAPVVSFYAASTVYSRPDCTDQLKQDGNENVVLYSLACP
jgi:hypothetical protein